MKAKIITFYYIISIIMMANDAFFTWLGMITHINFWRQIITLIGFWIVYTTLKSNDGLVYIKNVYRQYKIIFLILAGFSFITIVFNGYSLERVAYTLWNYSFGLPFLLFPYYTRRSGWSEHKFNWLFIFLGTFLSMGILADFLSGGFFTSSFLLAVTLNEDDFEAGRFCFLSSAPTIFTVYYCFCLFCLMNEMIASSKAINKFSLLLLSFLFIFGSIFCGSRQTLASLMMVELIGLWNLFRVNKASLILAMFALATAYMFLPQAREMLSDNQGFQDRYTSEAIQEDERTKTWKEGFEYCFVNPTIRRVFIGDGVGRTTGRGSALGDTGKHFENTFLARISDVGWIMAFWMLLLPVYYILKYRNKRLKTSLMYLGIIGAFIFVSMISPNGAGNTTQMALFLTLGKVFEEIKG